jgi:hypothetical protein
MLSPWLGRRTPCDALTRAGISMDAIEDPKSAPVGTIQGSRNRFPGKAGRESVGGAHKRPK